jgi:hypothetical protein
MTVQDDSVPTHVLPPASLQREALRQAWVRSLRQRSPPRHSVTAGILGCVLAVILHVMLIGSLINGNGHQVFRRDRSVQSTGASVLNSSDHPAVTMVMINLPVERDPRAPTYEQLASRGFASPDLAITILNADFKPAVAKIEESTDPRAKPAPEAIGDTSDLALMFGRYLGQIKARVDRGWIRPRSAVDSGEFVCQAQIDEDAAGQVKHVELRSCNGDDRWKQSLIRAIRLASPLPPPAEPSLHTPRVMVSFRAAQWSASSRADDYESADAHLATMAREAILVDDLH